MPGKAKPKAKAGEWYIKFAYIAIKPSPGIAFVTSSDPTCVGVPHITEPWGLARIRIHFIPPHEQIPLLYLGTPGITPEKQAVFEIAGNSR